MGLPSYATSHIESDASKSCSAAGINDGDPVEYEKWDNGVIVPLTSRRITNLRIDHTGHAGQFGSAGQRSRGASTKDPAISGASYLFELIEAWTRHNDGAARLVVNKDRHGQRKKNDVAANIEVIVQDDGRKVDIKLTAPLNPAKASVSDDKPLTAGARSLRALKALGTWATAREVQAWDGEHRPSVGGDQANYLKVETCYQAMKRLSDEDKLQRTGDNAGAYFALPTCEDEPPGTKTYNPDDAF